jgi:hypothetical protein
LAPFPDREPDFWISGQVDAKMTSNQLAIEWRKYLAVLF